jgi:hypothetical protein
MAETRRSRKRVRESSSFDFDLISFLPLYGNPRALMLGDLIAQDPIICSDSVCAERQALPEERGRKEDEGKESRNGRKKKQLGGCKEGEWEGFALNPNPLHSVLKVLP